MRAANNKGNAPTYSAVVVLLALFGIALPTLSGRSFLAEAAAYGPVEFWWYAKVGPTLAQCRVGCALRPGGFVATIMSLSENMKAYYVMPSDTFQGMLGGSRLTDTNNFRWTEGPEGLFDSGLGIKLWNGKTTAGSCNLNFCNFVPGVEPNNYGSGEPMMYMYGNSGADKRYWNDDALVRSNCGGCICKRVFTRTATRSSATTVTRTISASRSAGGGGESEFWLHAARAPSFADCRSMCALRTGGFMATISTAQQNERARQTLPNGVKLAMLGGSRLTDTANFRWTEGPLSSANGGLGALLWAGQTSSGSCALGSYCNFQSGQPNNAAVGGEPILYLVGPSGAPAWTPGKWVDAVDAEQFSDGCVCMRFNTYSLRLSPSRSQDGPTASATWSRSYSNEQVSSSWTASSPGTVTLSTSPSRASKTNPSSRSWTDSFEASRTNGSLSISATNSPIASSQSKSASASKATATNRNSTSISLSPDTSHSGAVPSRSDSVTQSLTASISASPSDATITLPRHSMSMSVSLAHSSSRTQPSRSISASSAGTLSWSPSQSMRSHTLDGNSTSGSATANASRSMDGMTHSHSVSAHAGTLSASHSASAGSITANRSTRTANASGSETHTVRTMTPVTSQTLTATPSDSFTLDSRVPSWTTSLSRSVSTNMSSASHTASGTASVVEPTSSESNEASKSILSLTPSNSDSSSLTRHRTHTVASLSIVMSASTSASMSRTGTPDASQTASVSSSLLLSATRTRTQVTVSTPETGSESSSLPLTSTINGISASHSASWRPSSTNSDTRTATHSTSKPSLTGSSSRLKSASESTTWGSASDPATSTLTTTATTTFDASTTVSGTLSDSRTVNSHSPSHPRSDTHTLLRTRTPTVSATMSFSVTLDSTSTPTESYAKSSSSQSLSSVPSRSSSRLSSTRSPSLELTASHSVSSTASATTSGSVTTAASPSSTASPTADPTLSLASWTLHLTPSATLEHSVSGTEQASATAGTPTLSSSTSASISGTSSSSTTLDHPSGSASVNLSRSTSASEAAHTTSASISSIATLSSSLSSRVTATWTHTGASQTVEATPSMLTSDSVTRRTPSASNASTPSHSSSMPSDTFQHTASRSAGSRSYTAGPNSASASVVFSPSPTLGYLSTSPSAATTPSDTSSLPHTPSPTLSISETVSASSSVSLHRTPTSSLTASASNTSSTSLSQSASLSATQTPSQTHSPSASSSRSPTLSSSTSHSCSHTRRTHSPQSTASMSLSASSVMSATGATPTVMDLRPYAFVVRGEGHQEGGGGPAHWSADGLPAVVASSDTGAVVRLYAVEIDGTSPSLAYRGHVNISVASASHDVLVRGVRALDFPLSVDIVLPCRVELSFALTATTSRCAWASSELVWVTIAYPFLGGATYTRPVRILRPQMPQAPPLVVWCPVLVVAPHASLVTAVPQQLEIGFSHDAVYGTLASVHVSVERPWAIPAAQGEGYAYVDRSTALLATHPTFGRADLPVVFALATHSSVANATVHLLAHVMVHAPVPMSFAIAATATLSTCALLVQRPSSGTTNHVFFIRNVGPTGDHLDILVAQPVTAAVGTDRWLCVLYAANGWYRGVPIGRPVAAQRADACTLRCRIPNVTLLAAAAAAASTTVVLGDVRLVSVHTPIVQRRLELVWGLPIGSDILVASPSAVVRGVQVGGYGTAMTLSAGVLEILRGALPEISVDVAVVGPSSGMWQRLPPVEEHNHERIVTITSVVANSTVRRLDVLTPLPVLCSSTPTGFRVPNFLVVGLDGTTLDVVSLRFTASIRWLVDASPAGESVVTFNIIVGPDERSCVLKHPAAEEWSMLDVVKHRTPEGWYVAGCPMDVFPVTVGCRGGERLTVHTPVSELPVHTTPDDIAVQLIFTSNAEGQRLSLFCQGLTIASPPPVNSNNNNLDPMAHNDTTMLSLSCTLPSIAATSHAVDLRILSAAAGDVLADLMGALHFASVPDVDSIVVPEPSPCSAADGSTCSGHGVCTASGRACACVADATIGYWGGATCSSCASGYFGNDCTSRCPSAECAPCSGHGACDDGRNGTGQCACLQSSNGGHWAAPSCNDCSPGYYGEGCIAACPQDPTTGKACGGSARGICSEGIAGSGACICNRGFVGVHCEACDVGFFGATCAQCPSATTSEPCSGQGTCNDGAAGNGTCTCDAGAGGPACEIACPTSPLGATCGWGKCVSMELKCLCTWPVVKSPVDGTCTLCAPGWWGLRCVHECRCVHGDCNATTGRCVCDTGYWGPNCSERCAGGAANPPCSGHGNCNPETGTCACYANAVDGFYDGATCSRCHPSYMSANCSIPCPADAAGVVCAGRGRCFNGACEGACASGRWGATCQYECPGGEAHPCSGNGACSETSGACDCRDGAVGDACQFTCPGFETPATSCSNHGICTPTAACLCHSDSVNGFWHGAACDVCAPSFTGPRCTTICNPSSGRVVNGTCVCAIGYVGPGCALLCPTDGTGRVCSGSGACVWNPFADIAECKCVADHYGPGCDVFCTPQQCQSGGSSSSGFLRAQCNQSTGACECQNSDAGHFQGERCDSCVDGWWGAECNAACPCGGRGSCGRYTPTCNCATGLGSGHWEGPSCGDCAIGYVGATCTQQNLELSNVASTTTRVDNYGFPQNGVSCLDPSTNVLIVGANPIAIFQTDPWTTRLELLQVLPLPSPAIACSIANDTHLAMHLLPQGVALPVPMVLLDRRALTTGDCVVPSPLSLAHESTASSVTRRVVQSLSSTDDFTVVADPATGCEGRFTASSPVVTVSCGRTTDIWSCSGGLVHWIGFVGWRLVISCTSVGGWRLIGVPINATASPLLQNDKSAAFNVSSKELLLAECASRGGCIGVSHCVATNVGDGSTLVCAANTARNVLVFFALDSTTGLLSAVHGPPVLVEDASNVSAAVSDSNFNNGIFAFEGPTTAMLCRIQYQPLALITRFALERANGDRPLVLSMVLNATTRTLWLSVATAHVVRAVALNLFSVRIVEPRVLDQRGGATVTVRGFGFVADPTPLCDFEARPNTVVPSGASSVATFVDDTTLLCTAASVSAAEATCATLHVNVWYGARATRSTLAGTLRPLTATVDTASTIESGGRPSAVHTVATTITLHGFGFVKSATHAACRLDDATTGATLHTFSATALGATTALCHFPTGGRTTPTAPGSVMRFSHDGFVFSTSAAVFAVVGDYAGIRATTETSSVGLPAAQRTALPPITVEATDSAGNSLRGWVDQQQRTVQCSTLAPLLFTHTDAHLSALGVDSVRSVVISRGVAEFTNLSLASPLATAVTVYFFDTLDLTVATYVVFTVVPGAPARLAVAATSHVTTWISGVERPATLPSFSIIVVDDVGNAVTNASVLLRPVTLQFTNSLPPAEVGNGSATQAAHDEPLRRVAITMLATLDLGTASFVFDGVTVRSPFDAPVVLSFTSGLSSMSPLTITLPQQRCGPQSYGVAGGFHCAQCPEHATCDGSTNVVANKGYWRGRSTSVYLYPCDRTDSCHTSTVCAEAYEGPLCRTCAEGHGRSLTTCAPCTADDATPWVIVVAIIVAVVVAVWLLGLRSIAFTSAADVAARVVSLPAKRSTLSIVGKVALSHLQTLSLLPLRLIAVSWMSDILSSSGSWSVVTPGFLNAACATGRHAVHEMRATVVLLGAAFAGCLIIALVMSVRDDLHFTATAKHTVASIRAMCTKAVHASPIRFQAADRALTEAHFPRSAHRAAVLRNHKQFLEAYVGDVRSDPNDPATWLGTLDDGIDIDAPVPLEDLVVHRPDADGQPLPEVIPRPPLWTRVLNVGLVSTAVLTLLLYPTIVQSALQLLRCRTLLLGDNPLDTASVLAYDPTVDCTSDAYAGMRVEAILVLALVGLGVPILWPLLILVARTITCRGSLERALQLFHVISGGYRVWYWESIVVVRKALAVGATVLIDDDQEACFVVFWILGVAMCLDILLRPWGNQQLRCLEAASLGALMFTSVCLTILSRRVQDNAGPFSMVLGLSVVVVNAIVMAALARAACAGVMESVQQVPAIMDVLTDPAARIASLRAELCDVQHALAATHPRLQAFLRFMDGIAAPTNQPPAYPQEPDGEPGRCRAPSTTVVDISSCPPPPPPDNDDDDDDAMVGDVVDCLPFLSKVPVSRSVFGNMGFSFHANDNDFVHPFEQHAFDDAASIGGPHELARSRSMAAHFYADIECFERDVHDDVDDDHQRAPFGDDAVVAEPFFQFPFSMSRDPSRPTSRYHVRHCPAMGDVFLDDIDVRDLMHQPTTKPLTLTHLHFSGMDASTAINSNAAFAFLDDEISVGCVDVDHLSDCVELTAPTDTHVRIPAAFGNVRDAVFGRSSPPSTLATERLCSGGTARLADVQAALSMAYALMPRLVMAMEADIACRDDAHRLDGPHQGDEVRGIEASEQRCLHEIYEAEAKVLRLVHAISRPSSSQRTSNHYCRRGVVEVPRVVQEEGLAVVDLSTEDWEL